MTFLKNVFASLTKNEFKTLMCFAVIFLIAGIALTAITISENSTLVPVQGGMYREGIVGQPIAVNPVISGNPTDQDISALIYPKISDIIDTYTSEDNGRVFILNLKEGLVWDDTKPLSSDDIVFTIQTAQELGNQSPISNTVKGVVAERMSELQVRLALPVPYSFFDETLKKILIIPKHVFGSIPAQNIKLSSYNLEPVGSGPYRFKTFSQRKDGFITEYQLIKNETYYGTQPFIQKFVFRFYENEENLLKAFRLREIDGFGSVGVIETKTMTSQQTKITSIPMSRYYALFFNLGTNEMLKNDSVRKALSLSIDKNQILSAVFPDSSAEIIRGPLLKRESSSQNIEDAEAILKKAKISAINLSLTVPKIDFLEKTAEEIKKQWMNLEEVENITIRTVEPKDIVEKVVKTNEYEILLFGNILENKKDLFPFWHSSERMYPGLNLSFYKNTKLDLLIETIRQTKDATKQQVLLKTAEDEILGDDPAVFLYTIPYTYIHTSELGGVVYEENPDLSLSNPRDRFLNVEKWYVTKARVLE
ncbi:MAG: ABC transporter substrate-binding protein [Patescibacteria group bacterium]